MTEKSKVLIIDDDASIIRFYEKSFYDYDSNFMVHSIPSCNEATKRETQHFHFVIIDIKLVIYRRNKITSLKDKVQFLRRFFENSKIVISIPPGDNYIIHQVLTHGNSDGIVIKKDLVLRSFCDFVDTVLSDTPYYSKGVLEYIRMKFAKNINLDEIDLALIKELSLGTKMKDIPKKVFISLSAVEKRKYHLKEVFGLSGKNDKHLIKVARQNGII